MKGAEFELEAQTGPHLLLTAGVGYTKATLAADAPSLGGLAGEQLQNVPRWNGSASARYSFEPVAGVLAFVRVDGQYVGVSYPDFVRTDPATFQRAYSLVDVRAGFTRGAWEADLFINNLLDRQAYLSRFISDNYDASSRSRMFTNRPRTVGVSVERTF